MPRTRGRRKGTRGGKAAAAKQAEDSAISDVANNSEDTIDKQDDSILSQDSNIGEKPDDSLEGQNLDGSLSQEMQDSTCESTKVQMEPEKEEAVSVVHMEVERDDGKSEELDSEQIRPTKGDIEMEVSLPEENLKEVACEGSSTKALEAERAVVDSTKGVVDEHTSEQSDTLSKDTTPGDVDKSQEELSKESQKEEPVVHFKPHTFPVFTNRSVVEKWEWHLKFFPIDQADIRSCILESVSKIAQETWMYIDKQNYGMGTLDMCLESHNDAAMVVLKTLLMPMTYRYLTIQVTRRGMDVRKENEDNGDESDDDSAYYTEVVETATLLLDFTYTATLDKVKGKEKRSLYVKYLPDGTSKELLKVLFPVASNMDIIRTAEGRSVGNLNVSTRENIMGICSAYVTVHINGCKTVSFDWKEENLDDGVVGEESQNEIPWEIIPRHFEYPYEAVPQMEEDEHVAYSKRRRITEENVRKKHGDGREWGWREREREIEREAEREVTDVLRMQHEMNETISTQIALLQSVEYAQAPALLAPPLVPLIGPEEPGFRDRDRRGDRRGNRFERERRPPIPEVVRHPGERYWGNEARERKRGRESGGRPSRWDSGDRQGKPEQTAKPKTEQEPPAKKDSMVVGEVKGHAENKTATAEQMPDNKSCVELEKPGAASQSLSDVQGQRDEKASQKSDSQEPAGKPNQFGRGDKTEGQNRGGRFGEIKGDRFGGGDKGSRFDRGSRGRFDERGGRFGNGGRFDQGRMQSGRDSRFVDQGMGERFDGYGRGHRFNDQEQRPGRFGDRGSGNSFDWPNRGRYEESGRANRFEDGGRGNRFDGKRGRMDDNRRGGRFDSQSGGNMDSSSRGGKFEAGIRGRRNSDNRRGGFDGSSGRVGRFDSQGRGAGNFGQVVHDPSKDMNKGNRFDNSTGGASGQGNFSQGQPRKNSVTNQRGGFGAQRAPQKNQNTIGNPQGHVAKQQVNLNAKSAGPVGAQQQSKFGSNQPGFGGNQSTLKNQHNLGAQQSTVGNQHSSMPGNQQPVVHSNTSVVPQSQQSTVVSQGNYMNQQQTSYGNYGSQQTNYNQNVYSTQNTYGSQPASYSSQQATQYGTQNFATPSSYGTQSSSYATNSQNVYGTQATNTNTYSNYTSYGNPQSYDAGQQTQQQQQAATQQATTQQATTQQPQAQQQAYAGGYWSQNTDYSQYPGYSTGQTNYSLGQTQQTQVGTSQAYSTTTAYTQPAAATGYSTDAAFASAGFYGTNQATATTDTTYSSYNSQQATTGGSYLTAGQGNQANQATYNFTQYSTGT